MLTPDGSAQARQPTEEDVLGDALRHAEGEGIPARNVVEVDARQGPFPVDHDDATHLAAGRNEPVRGAEFREKLEGRCMHQGRLRRLRRACRGVQDQTGNRELGESHRGGQTRRTRADDQDARARLVGWFGSAGRADVDAHDAT
jgi:hypothetical protein